MINMMESFELFYNLAISAKFWQNATNIDGKEQNKKLTPVGLNQGPLDYHSNCLLTVLGRYVLGSKFLK